MRTYLLVISITAHDCYGIDSKEAITVNGTYHNLESAKKDLKELSKRYLRPIKLERSEVTINKVFEDELAVMIVTMMCCTTYRSNVCELTTIKIIEV